MVNRRGLVAEQVLILEARKCRDRQNYFTGRGEGIMSQRDRHKRREYRPTSLAFSTRGELGCCTWRPVVVRMHPNSLDHHTFTVRADDDVKC